MNLEKAQRDKELGKRIMRETREELDSLLYTKEKKKKKRIAKRASSLERYYGYLEQRFN